MHHPLKIRRVVRIRTIHSLFCTLYEIRLLDVYKVNHEVVWVLEMAILHPSQEDKVLLHLI